MRKRKTRVDSFQLEHLGRTFAEQTAHRCTNTRAVQWAGRLVEIDSPSQDSNLGCLYCHITALATGLYSTPNLRSRTEGRSALGLDQIKPYTLTAAVDHSELWCQTVRTGSSPGTTRGQRMRGTRILWQVGRSNLASAEQMG
ncbi:hypothetical protein RRG08_038647 [Elysia crispata]|uniref:Uncharacterized protein n=1 Tax=Elysia crispata TaxID=231223 RepID=A0AAE0YKM1_9GAST|nr:hypothetical protein RRG08_038647 [Elysia crispata]